MIKYDLLKNVSSITNVIDIWNEEYGFIFPITEELFARNVSNKLDEASFVAYYNNEIVGFIIGKTWDQEETVNKYDNMAWISLIYVKKAYRKQGIGSTLLSKAIDKFRSLNKTVCSLGADFLNFFPGLPVDFKASLTWFNKRNFESTYQCFDLIKMNNSTLLPIHNKNYTFCDASSYDRNALYKFLNDNFSYRWYKECFIYFKNGGTGKEYYLCLNENKEIIAFAKVNYPTTPVNQISYNLTWYKRFEKLGGIGPLGVNPAYRGSHLGHDIVSGAVNELINSNVSNIIIDWTGLLEFYRPLGFEVWKSYYCLSLNL